MTDEYRNSLIELEHKIGEGFDKTLIALSGGALGLTLTFIKDIVGPQSVEATNFALLSWCLWTASLSSLLLAYYFGSLSYRHALKSYDKGNLNADNPGGGYATATNIFNVVGVVAFILGVMSFIYFAFENLGSTS